MTRTLFDAFKFTCLESGENVSVGKRLFVEHLVNIFPNVQKERVNERGDNGRSIVTYYKSILLKSKLQTEQTEYPFDFINIKDFVKQSFVLTKKTEKNHTTQTQVLK